MVEIRAKLKVRRSAYRIETKGRLRLAFDARQKSRMKVALESGEEMALMLPRGEILRGGDLVTASDGRVIEVVAAPEKLLHIECASGSELAKAAYHLGNRHVPVEVGAGFLRLADDHVLKDMLEKLGARVSAIEAPFEPEAGAYAGGHRHDEMGHGGKIHEFGEPPAEHVHDEHCGHDHHGHDHASHGHAAVHDRIRDHEHHDHAAHGGDQGAQGGGRRQDHDHAHEHGHDHAHGKHKH